jgi:dipeptidyl aminopeptidase/acylaminoacyl peptidase
VNRIERPLIIGQGANDPKAKKNEPNQTVTTMKAKNLSVTYVRYPDEGHGFVRSENELSFYAIVDTFLAKNLGGRYRAGGQGFSELRNHGSCRRGRGSRHN